MMTGEFEYESIFHNDPLNHLEFDNLTFVFFLVFLIIMSIIVVNLLIGLAVDDIKAVQDQAILKRLAMQVELVLDVERLLPNFLLRRLTKQKESIKHKQKRWWNVFTDVVDRSSIIKDAHQLTNDSQRNSTGQLLEVLDTLSENIKTLKFEFKKLSEENKENRRLLNALADRNSIYMDDGDSVSVLWTNIHCMTNLVKLKLSFAEYAIFFYLDSNKNHAHIPILLLTIFLLQIKKQVLH